MEWLLVSLYFRYPVTGASFMEEDAGSPSTSSWSLSSACCHSPVGFSALHVMTQARIC